MWQDGRLGTGYSKLAIFSSLFLEMDAYILKIPAGVKIPPHFDKVRGKRHFRMNITLKGCLRMQTRGAAFKLGQWFSFFRPDIVQHCANPPSTTTYILSIGWLRSYKK